MEIEIMPTFRYRQVLTAFEERVVRNLDFRKVVEISGGGMHNMSSHYGEDFETFLKGKGIDPDEPFILMATHSLGGRDWTLEGGAKPPFYPESCFGGGWYVIREDDVTDLLLESGTSACWLTFEKIGPGDWTCRLQVPVRNGELYEGAYWASFHEALGIEGHG